MSDYVIYSDELQHYGVLGMKWGVRKNPSRAYAKALRKKTKLESRVDRANKDLNRAKGEVDEAERNIKSTTKNLEVAEARKGLAATKYNAKKYELDNSKHDFLGNKAKAFKNAEKELNEATRDYDTAVNAKNQAVVNWDTKTKEVAQLSSYAQYTLARSERWNRAMNKTFASVSKADIEAGQKMYEEMLNRRKRR